MIKTGNQIIEENTYIDPDYNPVVMSYKIAEAIDTQLREILAVIKPITDAPEHYVTDDEWVKLYNLVAELEAHGKMS